MNEYSFLLLSTIVIKSNLKIDETSKLMTSTNFVELAGQLLNHRLGGYFYMGLTKEQRKLLPKEMREALRLLVKAQELETRQSIELIKPILETFETAGLQYVGLKGLIFNAEMYEFGIRRSNDFDIMVSEDQLGLLDEILRSFGYIQSFLPDGMLVEATKKEKLIQRMNYHDLVPYVKEIDGKISEIDINFIFDTKENDITKKVFDMGIIDYSNDVYAIKGLKFDTNLAFLCIHFFREGTNSLWASGNRDMVLYKLVDIMNFIRKYEDKFYVEEWCNLVKELNIDKKCYYTFFVLSQFYSEPFINEVLSLLKPEDDSFIYEVKIEGENRIVKRTESFYDTAFNSFK